MKKIILTCFILLSFIMVTGCGTSSYKLDDSEAVAYTSLRLAIARSKRNSSGKLSKKDLDFLKNAVKNQNSKNEWFDSYLGTFYGVTKDTSDYQIDLICNSDYCAKLKVKKGNLDYYLEEYSFEENDEKDIYRIELTDEDVDYSADYN